ncbi:MAG: OmpA family protein [Pseudomonadota bacterium]
MTQGVARLKELLFDTENETIAKLDQRLNSALDRVASLEGLSDTERSQRLELIKKVDELFSRAGTQERFGASVAEVLDDALRAAEVDNHEEVARAMAPLVVQTIQVELRNSQDELVDILYPITGRMVKAYVATAMSDLVRQLNRRIEQNGAMLRLRSMVSGKSVAELAIVDSQHLKVEEIFLIRRGSGALVARWPAGVAKSNSDVHVSGVISAINDFATHTFQADGGQLRSFELDEFNIFLRASPAYLVAAKCRGIAPTGTDAIFDDEFISLLERLHEHSAHDEAPVSAGELAPLASDVESRTAEIYAENERAGLAFSPFKALVFLLAIPLFAGLLWWGYTSMERAQTRRNVEAVIANFQQLKGYPINIDVGYRGKDVALKGLVPSSSLSDQINTQLKGVLGADTKLRTELTTLPIPAGIDPEPQIARLRTEMAAMEVKAQQRSIHQALEQTTRRLLLAQPELDRLRGAVKSDEQLKTLTKVKLEIESSLREIETYRAVAERTVGDVATLQSLTTPLHTLSMTIDSAANKLASLIDGIEVTRPSAHRVSEPSEPVIAAETLEAQAQRLATTAIAVAQTRLLVPQQQPVVSEKTDRERLEAFVKSNVIFFSNGDDFRDSAATQKVIDDLAQLLAKTSAMLRIAGYTDETGRQNRNNPLAQSRADKVLELLVSKGIDRNRLISVGRANGVNLSNATGPRSPNRRVQFEIAFRGETADTAQ